MSGWEEAAALCPFCGNGVVAEDRLDDEFKPNYIIPFEANKNEALKLIKDYFGSKRYLAKGFAEEARLVSMQGTYIPFWLFSGGAEFDFVVRKQSGKHAAYYSKRGTIEFSGVPADGSLSMPDDLMDSLEPFDYSALRAYSISYLPGFIAERHSVDVQGVKDRVAGRVGGSICKRVSSSVFEDDPFRRANDMVLEYQLIDQVLLPV